MPETSLIAMYFLITEDPRTDFMKPIDTGCSHGSRSVSESKAVEGKYLGFFYLCAIYSGKKKRMQFCTAFTGYASVSLQRNTRNGKTSALKAI